MAISSERDLSPHLRRLASEYGPLSLERERALILDAKGGNTRAANLLVLHHSRLAMKFAAKYKKSGLPQDELFNTAALGVAHAIKQYDFSCGARLVTYASFWARSYIHEMVRTSIAPVHIPATSVAKAIFHQMTRVEKMLRQAEDAGGLDTDLQKFSSKIGTSPKGVLEIYSAYNSLFPMSDDVSQVPDPSGVNMIDGIGLQEERKLFLGIVKSVLDKQSDRNKDLFVSRFFAEKPVKIAELAARHGLSIARIGQINDKIFREIREEFDLTGSKAAPLVNPKPGKPSLQTFQTILMN